MEFMLPNSTYEQKAREFIQEFSDQSSETNGDGGLSYFLSHSTYLEWLEKLKKIWTLQMFLKAGCLNSPTSMSGKTTIKLSV